MNTVCRAAWLVVMMPMMARAGVLLPKEPGSRPLSIRKQLIQIEVKDQVARATLDEVFENATDHPVEAIYQLALPEGAAVSGFATWIDGKRVESRVQEKKKAEQDFEAAKDQHRQPALLEENDARTFRTRVDGIPAHETKRVEASFAQILPYDSGTVTLRVPLAVHGISGAEPIGDFNLEVSVAEQKPITELKVISLRARVERVGKNRFHVSLKGTDVAPADELVLTYRTESTRLGLSFVPFKPASETEGYFLLLASPQELTTSADIVKKDVVFVFDTSGSMHDEDKIGQARQALRRCLSSLNAEDRFGIVAFSDSLNPYKNALIPASADNLRAAIEFAEGLRAGGGTNISGALLSGLKMLESSERPRVIVFMTDGVPTSGMTNIEEIARRVHAENKGGTRLFAFGVGSDVNRTFLERLARENRGSHDFVGSGENIDMVVGTFYAKISRPVLSDLALSFGEVTTVMEYPDVLPDLYKGSQLVLVGRYRGHGKVNATLAGTLNGQKQSLPFIADFPERAEGDSFVARIWAQKRIDFLLSQNRLQGEREEARIEIIALSEQYQILTPYTSMLATKPAQRVASISPQRVKPGDPVITVRAPRDARRVQLELPFGETKWARWDEAQQAWSARFLIPAGTADGTYAIRVIIEHADGRIEPLALSISVDTAAPVMVATAGPIRAGQPLPLRAVAILGPKEIATAWLTRDDPWIAIKALFDVRRATARLWDGREVELRLEPGGRGFSGTAETNSDLVPGRYPVVVTAMDFAGNQSRTTAMVEVRAP